MSCEEYWLGQREAFLAEAGQAESDSALLTLYQRLLEQMKASVLSGCPHEDVLRQQIALLFAQASQGTELYLSRNIPTLERGTPAGGKRVPAAATWLAKPAFLYAVLGAGLAFSLLAGKGAWRCGLFFAAALALAAVRTMVPAQQEGPVSVRTGIRLEYLDALALRQAKLIDRQVEDLRALLDDMTAPSDLPMEPAALALCQRTWAVANGQYPPESALYTAEQLLRANGLRWEEYDPARPQYYDVMPTKKAPRTVYPALCKLGDGSLVSKGQRLESAGEKEGAGA